MEKTEKNLGAMIDRTLVEHNKPTILPKPVPSYEHDFSEYPELIRVSFSDGSTAVYQLRTEQPHPLVLKNIEIMRETERNIKQGYVNNPERRRRRRR